MTDRDLKIRGPASLPLARRELATSRRFGSTRRASAWSRAAVLAGLTAVAAASSWWRTSHGTGALPGPVDLALLAAALVLFVLLDVFVGYSTTVWAMVGLLAASHMVFSLPAHHPLYDLRLFGSETVRLDHLAHFAAGALLAWVIRVAVLHRRGLSSPWALLAVPVAIVLFFAMSKEALDVLAVGLAHPGLGVSKTIAAWFAHRGEDPANTVLDVVGALVGALTLCGWAAWQGHFAARATSARVAGVGHDNARARKGRSALAPGMDECRDW